MHEDIIKCTVKPGARINLNKIDPNYTGKLQKKQSKIELINLHKKMAELQYKLHAEKKQALLIVLQAMDAGGKDSTIRDVMHGFNPQGCKVTPFIAPTELELSHDYLWRVHKVLPPKGEIGILNRSHYGDVLVVRIHNLVPQKQWSKRYEHINNFEKMLTDEGTKILKLFLYISKDEQKKRLDKRLYNPLKHWKVAEADFEERKYWDSYLKSYQVVFEKCSKPWAPWYIIPANKKWYRNWLVAQIITNALEEMNPKMPKATIDIEKFKKEFAS